MSYGWRDSGKMQQDLLVIVVNMGGYKQNIGEVFEKFVDFDAIFAI